MELPPPLSIEVQQAAAVTVVKVRGELDLATSAELFDCLRSQSGTVVVDFSALDFCDSSGMRALVRARKELRAYGGDLTVSSPSPNVRRALKALGLEFLIAAEEPPNGRTRSPLPLSATGASVDERGEAE
jgi:anti-anti-sigma factor